MISMKRLLVLSLAMGSMGCTNSALDEGLALQGENVAIYCACEWEGVYASEQECVREERSELDTVDPCDRRVYDEVAGVRSVYDCSVAAYRAFIACLRTAGCDEAAQAACGDAFDADNDACPEISDADQARALAIIEECRFGPPSGCPDGTVSGVTGTIASGSTRGAGDDLDGSCGGGSAPDRAVLWTAPSAGTWTFDTNGSDYDTVLYALTACDGEELACDDDGAEGYQSEITLELTAGQTILLVVDGFGDNAGDFVLNVTGP